MTVQPNRKHRSELLHRTSTDMNSKTEDKTVTIKLICGASLLPPCPNVIHPLYPDPVTFSSAAAGAWPLTGFPPANKLRAARSTTNHKFHHWQAGLPLHHLNALFEILFNYLPILKWQYRCFFVFMCYQDVNVDCTKLYLLNKRPSVFRVVAYQTHSHCAVLFVTRQNQFDDPDPDVYMSPL